MIGRGAIAANWLPDDLCTIAQTVDKLSDPVECISPF